jgi:hypothetical protein
MPKITVAVSHRVVDTVDVFVPDDSKDPEEDAKEKVEEMIENREIRYRDLDWSEGDDGIVVEDAYPA